MAVLRRRWGLISTVGLAVLVVAGLAVPPRDARAQIGSARYASIIMDGRTGAIVSAVNADEPRHPASLTKMMTLYMTFEALRDRRIALHQLVPISATAAAMSPTKLGLAPGSRLTVEEAILGLVTKSANDAAAALGEMLAGDEARFAQIMTLKARALGMTRTTFRNASGLPDAAQITTARDMALLGRRLQVDFPQYYGYFSTPTFVFRGRAIRNHDRLLGTYPGADGLKTGYTRDSGYNLVSSAVRGGVRLVGVVMGGASGGERDRHMMLLLDQGFAKMDVAPPGREEIVASRLPSLIGRAYAAQAPAPRTARESGAKALSTPRVASRPIAGYGVQVGSYSSARAANSAARAAQRVADGGDARVEQVRVKKKTFYRAQVMGLTSTDAQSTCAALTRKRMPCQIVRGDTQQYASR